MSRFQSENASKLRVGVFAGYGLERRQPVGCVAAITLTVFYVRIHTFISIHALGTDQYYQSPWEIGRRRESTGPGENFERGGADRTRFQN